MRSRPVYAYFSSFTYKGQIILDRQPNRQPPKTKPLYISNIQGFRLSLSGPDGTRTRDLLRDRQAF